MPCLMIENPGIAPVEAFTLLGFGTSDDGPDGTIGCFATGAKHAVNICLRNQRHLRIFCGPNEIQFGSRVQTVKTSTGQKVVQRATYKFNGDEPQDLGFTLDYGKHDWKGPQMVLREFISNALDQSLKITGDYIGATIGSTTDEPSGKEGHTRVYLPIDDEIQQYLSELGKHFLHFSGVESRFGAFLKTNERVGEPARLYREGVFIREVGSKPSRFDYNVPADEIEIDECRTLSDWGAETIIRSCLSNISQDQAEMVLADVINEEDTLEAYQCMISYDLRSRAIPAWTAAAKAVTKGQVVIPNSDFIQKQVLKKDKVPLSVSDEAMVVIAKQGATTFNDVLSEPEKRGDEFFPATESDRNLERRVWRALKRYGVTGDKVMPEVRYYERPTEADGGRSHGYVDKGVVFINRAIRGDSRLLMEAYLEEYIHILSGCGDETRGFQSFTVQALARTLDLSE